MNDERADLHLLYQVTTQDLAQFKNQQWLLTNYAILSYGGLVALKGVVATRHCATLVLVLVALLVAISAISLLWRLEKSIKGRRARLTHIRGSLSVEFNEAWGAMNKEEPIYLVPFWVLTFSLAIGCSLTCWALI
ncbi:hypothetical protein MTYP_02756 [Methylophilaceae bacterium]|jgi:hypothetical protein|nr:hypothetical protein MTYP_02756 [Methylophilaceae bacterium]